MRPPVDIVTSDTDLPEHADVVVIGGGIVGCATAWTLAKRGVSVVLCEKGRIGGEQSSRNWGFCRQQGRDPREIPLIIESLRIWRGIEKEIEAPVGFSRQAVSISPRPTTTSTAMTNGSSTPSPISSTAGW